MYSDINIFYANKRILITGAAGTIGKQIVKQLLRFNPSEIRLLDNNETELFFLMEQYKTYKNVFCFLGDVRDGERIKNLAKGIDIIIHTAAFKHVILSEYNPFEVIKTNILGVENIIEAALYCNVQYVLFTSSDKAVNPTNVMGASKLMGEKLMTAASTINSNIVFTSTRFGNVIGSRGSVIPVFLQQIKKGGPVTVTDVRMTRFIMTLEEASMLVLKSLSLAKGGEIFVTKMPVVRIIDLAEVMIEIFAPKFGYSPKEIEIKFIGAKPGEKLYEELMSEEETKRCLELKDMFVILPAFQALHKVVYTYPNVKSCKITEAYTSVKEKPLTKEELKRYLVKIEDVLGDSL